MPSRHSRLDLQPCQIVYLECEGDRLYAETIQIIESRQLAWVRPLLLTEDPPTDSNFPPQPIIWYDLRQQADLVWPLTLFQPALDTEVIPLLVQLNSPNADIKRSSLATQQLRSFIERHWQIYHSHFQTLDRPQFILD